MKFIKKYWYFVVISVITVGLGVMVFLTSQKLTNTDPVAPNVPQVTPQAAEPACTVTFTLEASPSATPTPTPTGVATPTPTPTPTPTGVATPTPTPTPIPLASCNTSCSVNTDCRSGTVCLDGFCRNPNCTEKTNCSCDVVTQTTPIPTPQIPVAGTGPSVLGISVIAGGFLLLLLGLAL